MTDKIQSRIDEFYKEQKNGKKQELTFKWKKKIYTNFRYER